eukprot:672520_1
MLFVLYCLFYCTVALTYEAEDSTHTGTIMYRSAASNAQTVHLDQGEYIEWEFSICRDSNSITIKNITLTYTNDGASDTLYIYLDSTYLGQFTTRSLTNSGAYWNSPFDSVLDGPFSVPDVSSSHTLKLVAQTTDTYGVEVDKIEVHLSIPSASIGQCYAVPSILDLINIYATYPIYFGDNPANQRGADFTSCDFSSNSDGGTVTETTQTLFDNGYLIIESVYVSNWWLGSFMTVGVSGGQSVTNAAYWRVTQKMSVHIQDYQQTMVMYQDGNIRLLPHPPSCYGDWIPFGSSIIIGNTVSDVQENRPYAAISTVNIYPTNNYKYMTANIVFENGDSLSIALDVGDSYTQISVSNITFSDPTGSLVTFRSMYVDADNNDVDTVRVNDNSMYGIMQISNVLEGSLFEFGRQCISKHNTLSPDISFVMNGHIATTEPTSNPTTMNPTISPSRNPTANPSIESSSGDPTVYPTLNPITKATVGPTRDVTHSPITSSTVEPESSTSKHDQPGFAPTLSTSYVVILVVIVAIMN